MKLIENSDIYNTYYKAVKIYIEDLKLIYDILHEYSDEIVIKTDKYSFSNWTDFETNCKYPTDLKFKLSLDGPRIINFELDAGLYGVSLEFSNSDKEVAAHLFFQIDAVLNNKQINFSLNVNASAVILLIIIVVSILTKISKIDFPLFYYILLAFGTSIGFILTAIEYPKNKIYLYKKGENKNILQRTKDAIFANVISSLFVAVVSFILGYIVTKYGILR